MTEPNLEDVYELSPMQQGMLFHTLYDPDRDLYFEQCVVTLAGKLDQDNFARAWRRVATRHSILRTSFHWEGLEKPVQVVHTDVEVPFRFLDWSDLPEPVQRSRFDAFIQDDRRKSFDLASAPLFRVAVVRRGEELYDCLLSFQHLLLDRWSRFLVLNEVFTEYGAGAEGARLPATPPYGDYIAWLQARDRGQAEAFWRRELAGFTTPTSLRSDSGVERAAVAGFEEASIQLSPGTTAGLQSFARRNRLTMNTLVEGAWAVLASRYSGEDDIVFGVVVSGRPTSLRHVESMVGLFVNTLPVRVRVPASEPVLPWLERLQKQLAGLREREYSALLDIQGWSEIPRGTPLFESLVVFENVGGDSASLAGSGPLDVLGVRSIGGRTNYPLTLFAFPGPQLGLRIDADRGFFGADTPSRMLGHLETLLEGMAAYAERPISRLPLLTPGEQRQVLEEWNRTAMAYPHEATVHGLFEQQVKRAPDAEAVVFGDERLTYRQLNERANRLARHLGKLGVGPEILVGLCVDRSLEMVVGLLGILKAGGAYVPLDPNYPRQRLAFMLEDSAAPVVVTQQSLSEALPEGSFERVLLDTDWPKIAHEESENPASQASSENLAYAIYTSGSTGRPKGVLIRHRSVANLFAATQPVLGFGRTDVWTAFHSYAFDLSAWEIWGALLHGGRLVIVPAELTQSPGGFAQLLIRERVTVASLTPAAARQLAAMRRDPAGGATEWRLRLLICGGEALPADLAAELLSWDVPLWNFYGPTEATVWTTIKRVEPSDCRGPTVSIGCPIANTQVYVLDRHREPVPVGVPGELYIGGEGLARGYLRRTELDREKFISHPFDREPGARLYATGDRARLRPDGSLEFLGRLDHQVKIRGYRVELGEIEAAISQHTGVREAVAVVHQDTLTENRLIAYLVVDRGLAPAVAQLRTFLRATLPDHMVPSVFVFLDALPLTPNGKIDRRALPAPDGKRSEAEPFVAPRTPVESALAEIWKEILRVDRVSVQDNFFELGGHSLLATQLVSRVADSFGLRLPLRRLFEQPTVEGLSLVIAEALAQAEQPESMLRVLAEIRGLSDEEARIRLARETHPGTGTPRRPGG